MKTKRVLIVGAGGFVGGFLAAEGLKRGYKVDAGIRKSTSKKYLTDPELRFLTLDLEDISSLAITLKTALKEGEKWDWIIYNLGATKALSFRDFSKINCEYLRHFIEALKQAEMVPEKFLFISSLSVMGPGDERGYTPFKETMTPAPDTKYGASKLKAELELQISGIPYIIFRCTGIYGPRDRDYFLMFDAMRKGVDFSVGYRKQLLTFIYVEDLAEAVYNALEKAPTGEIYNISEPKAYTQKEFRKLAAKALNKKFIVGIPLPLWAVKGVATIAEKIGVARGKPSTLNRDKYNILKQRNWNTDISKAQRDFGFSPKTDLKDGVAKSIEWYKKEGWL